MQSARPRKPLSRLALLGLALAAGLGGLRKGGRGRATARARRQAPPADSADPVRQPMRLRWGWVAAALLAVVVAAVAVVGGYRLKHDHEQRASAIALTQGDPDHGRDLTMLYGCRGCHTIPGVPGASGHVGPNLGDLARQVYVAGVVTNTPDNLMRWIENPKAIDPKTAMPVTGISAEEARDVAAYLYSLP